MRIHRWVLVALAVPLAMLSCTPVSPAGTEPPRQEPERVEALPQRTLVVAVRGEPPSIASRTLVDFSGSLRRPRQLFNANLDYLDERETPRAQLAEALPKLNTDTWRVFPDGRMETIYKLRPNLTWHDGVALSAEDFVFAWRIYSTPDFGQAATRPIGQMEEVVAPDPRTVMIRWRNLYPDADRMDHDFQALPRHILEGPFRDLDPSAFIALPFWTLEYVGLGPYRLTRWEPGSFVEGSAFANYALGRPKIEKVKALFITDPQTALANIMAGEVHLVADPVFSVSEGLTLEQHWAQDKGGTILYSPIGLRQSLFQFRPEYAEPALLDVRVRRAARSGMDAEAAVEVLTAGKGVLTHTLTSPRVEVYPEIERVIAKYSYDPRRAQELMAEAGFRKGPEGFFVGGDGKPLRFSLASSAGERQELEVAVFVDSLRRAGFEVSQLAVPVQQIRDPQTRALLSGMQVRGGGEGHIRYTSEQIPRPENRWHGDNRGGWSNPEYDRLVGAYMSTLEPSERVRQLAQLERIVNEEVPIIPHLFNVYAVPHVAALHGPVARHTPNAGHPFLHVHLWEWRS